MAAQPPATLSWTPNFQGQGYIAGANTGGGNQREAIQIGANGFPVWTPPVSQAAAAGGTFQCTQWWQGQFTIATGVTHSLNLSTTVNGIGGTVDFSGGGTTIKYCAIAILLPDGGATKGPLWIGPQGVANAWQGPFFAATANYYIICASRMILVDEVEGPGYTVTAATGNILPITNKGSATVTVQVFIMG